MRTIIDILQKGNQELFHSSMIAWLLDPSAEHGLGCQFLTAFADALAARDCPQLKDAVAEHVPTIRTEVTTRKRRYDIEIQTPHGLFVIENKTKSLGDVPQFHRYDQANAVLIAMGLCDISFSDKVASTFPVVTYSDVLHVLQGLDLVGRDPFTILIGEYRRFLERELSMFKFIDDCYQKSMECPNNPIAEVASQLPGFTDNDRRFLNLYYLEKLRHHLNTIRELAGAKWRGEKNEISGTWLANYAAGPDGYVLHDWLARLCHNYGAHIWFHIELKDGVSANGWDDIAGVIQLRCQAQGANKDLLAGFVADYGEHLEPEQYLCSRTKDGASTFYCVARRLTRRELPFGNMTKTLMGFMGKFGRFAGKKKASGQ